MNVGLNASVSGMNAAAINQGVTANNVANVNTSGFTSKSTVQADVYPSGTVVSAIRQDASGTNDMTKQMTDLGKNKNMYSLNAKAFKVQNQMTGELIDLAG